jgi:hypothetical protein
VFPDTGRIYHEQVSQDNDVTPSDEATVERLQELDGTLYVVIYPGDPITIIIAVVAVAAVAAAAFLLAPKIPSVTTRNTQTESPNNALADRQNSPRPNGRIPDIYGTVRSTPDMLAVSYKIFDAHEEVEYAYMAVGVGEYDIPATEVKDDTTPVSSLAGVSVEIFAPHTSPNSGHDPQLRIGAAIGEPLRRAVRMSAVNGQVLRPPNADSFAASNNVRFVYPDEIQLDAAAAHDFSTYFAAGDSLTVSNASHTSTVSGSGVNVTYSIRFTDSGGVELETDNTSLFSVGDTVTVSGAYFTYNGGANAVNLDGTYVIQGKTTSALTLQSPGSVNTDWNLLAANFTNGDTPYKSCTLVVPSGQVTVDLSGTYTILSVSSDIITLADPSSSNADWNTLGGFSGDQTGFISPLLQTSGDKWIGPFVLDASELNAIYANFVALNGLYKDDGTNQIQFNVSVEIEATPINSAGAAIGTPEVFTGVIVGSTTSRTTRALTIKAYPTFTGRCSVRARRVTNADLSFAGTVVDEVKWRDMYSMSPVNETNFGDVTTVHSVTYATSGALAVKDRKLNMLVTRKIPTRVSGNVFTTNLTATNRIDEIIAHVCLAPHIGNRSVDELDLDNIYNTVSAIETYFGTSKAVEFNYTFDSDNLSFEETLATVAAVIFCTAYRRGNVINIKFDGSDPNSVLLFNHRNKLPGSETRTIRFGNQNDNDGVEYEYVDPEDDAVVTYYLPLDQSAVNPKRVESLGVRGKLQAHFHANRVWNKIRYQNVATEFEATQEADILVVSDRVLVADNTRPDTQDGEIVSQDGLSLTTSQDVVFDAGKSYNMFIQHVDGTTESIAVTAGATLRTVTLAQAPRAALSLDAANYARALYYVVDDVSTREQAFTITEKEPQAGFTSLVRAVNYDERYYSNDTDYTDGVVNVDGDPI